MKALKDMNQKIRPLTAEEAQAAYRSFTLAPPLAKKLMNVQHRTSNKESYRIKVIK